MAEPVFDVAVLNQHGFDFTDDPAGTADDIAFFITHAQAHGARIAAAHGAGDVSSLLEECHRLASNAAYFGLTQLSVYCRAAERALAQSEATMEVMELEPLITSLELGVAALKQHVAQQMD